MLDFASNLHPTACVIIYSTYVCTLQRVRRSRAYIFCEESSFVRLFYSDLLPSPSRTPYSDEPHSSKSLVQTISDGREEASNRGSREKKRHAEHTDDKSAKRRKHKDTHTSKSDSHSKKSSSSQSDGSGHRDRSRERVWVAPNLRVRIIDTKFKGGKYYNSKVSYINTCMCVCTDDIYTCGFEFRALTL